MKDNVRLLEGKKHICLEKSGIWHLESLDECFKLEQDIFEIDTSGPVHLSLLPTAYKLQGSINFEYDSDEEIGLTVAGGDDASAQFEFEDTRDREFSLWVPVQEIENSSDVVIAPFSKTKNSLTIFEPASQSIDMEGTCKSGMTFKAIEGMLISGSSTPPVPGAQVIVQRILPDGSLEQSTTVELDNEGKYTIGPIAKDAY